MALILAFLYIFWNRIEICGPFVLVRAREYAQRLRDIGEKYDVIFRTFGYFSIFFFPYLMYIGFKNLLLGIIYYPEKMTVSIVIPGFRIPGTSVKIPLIPGLIAIFILALVHELAHFFVAVAHRIKIKSVGIGLLIAIPFAFVEPYEEDIASRDAIQRLSVYSAGSVANFILAMVLFNIMSVLYLAVPSKVIVVGVDPASNLYTVIGNRTFELYAINGMKVNKITDIPEILKMYKPGDTVTLDTSIGEIKTILGEKDGKPYIGILVKDRFPWIFEKFIFPVLYWTAFLNFAVGIFNALPLPVIDGGKYIDIIIEEFVGEGKAAHLLKLFIYFLTLLLLLTGIILPRVPS